MQKKREGWKSEQLAILSQQLQQLLKSGLPMVQSIEILMDQQVLPEKRGKPMVQSLQRGCSFSETLRKEKFPDLFVSFIRAAEEHGDYGFGLKQCETYYRSRAQFIREVSQAATYPLIVFICVGIALTFMITIVLPRFAELYQTLGVELPAITRYLLSLMNVAQTLLWYGFILIVTLFFIARYLQLQSPSLQSKIERTLVRIPLLNTWIRFRLTHYVSIQLGSLLRAGVPLLAALELMEKLSPWVSVREAIHSVKEQVMKGSTLHHSFQSSYPHLFLPSLPRMVAVGERSGYLDQSLISLATSTETLMHNQLKKWTSSFEPILIFVVGIFIAITVVAMFLPMLQLVEAI